MLRYRFDDADYSVVVKNRGSPPNAWRWEIYRAGRWNPVEQSPVLFRSMVAANKAGKAALKQLLASSTPNPVDAKRDPISRSARLSLSWPALELMDNTALLAEVLELAYATKISEKLVSQQFERKPPNCGWRHFHGKLVVFMIPDTLNSWPHVVGIHSDRAVTADVEPCGSVFCFILWSRAETE